MFNSWRYSASNFGLLFDLEQHIWNGPLIWLQKSKLGCFWPLILTFMLFSVLDVLVYPLEALASCFWARLEYPGLFTGHFFLPKTLAAWVVIRYILPSLFTNQELCTWNTYCSHKTNTITMTDTKLLNRVVSYQLTSLPVSMLRCQMWYNLYGKAEFCWGTLQGRLRGRSEDNISNEP
jgi:hypothetical protein